MSHTWTTDIVGLTRCTKCLLIRRVMFGTVMYRYHGQDTYIVVDPGCKQNG